MTARPKLEVVRPDVHDIEVNAVEIYIDGRFILGASRAHHTAASVEAIQAAARHVAKALGADVVPVGERPAPVSGPITLPEVPPGTVALKGNRTGAQYVRAHHAEDRWKLGDPEAVGATYPWSEVLGMEHPDGVTPVPPEPRRWEKLTEVGYDDLPRTVQVKPDTGFVTVWRRVVGSRDYTDGGRSMRLEQLRYLGAVTEVIEP